MVGGVRSAFKHYNTSTCISYHKYYYYLYTYHRYYYYLYTILLYYPGITTSTAVVYSSMYKLNLIQALMFYRACPYTLRGLVYTTMWSFFFLVTSRCVVVGHPFYFPVQRMRYFMFSRYDGMIDFRSPFLSLLCRHGWWRKIDLQALQQQTSTTSFTQNMLYTCQRFNILGTTLVGATGDSRHGGSFLFFFQFNAWVLSPQRPCGQAVVASNRASFGTLAQLRQNG